MNSSSSDVSGRNRESEAFGTTRRAVLAAGGAVALTGLAGCAALDGLIDRAGEQVIGTTVSAPAAFYPGRSSSGASASHAGVYGRGGGTQFYGTAASDHQVSDGLQVFRTGPGDVRHVPATARAEGREITLEGWSTGGVTKAQDYNASRSNKPSGRSEAQDYNSSRSNKFEWWVGPGDDIDDDDDEDDDILVELQDLHLDLLATTATAAASINKRSARTGRIHSAMDDSNQDTRATAERCSDDVCRTIVENADDRERLIRQMREHADNEEWDQAAAAVNEVRDSVLGDIERLDDELEDRRPSRPRFSDIIGYLDDEPTIGERFTVCLPDATLPGDRGSLAGELTPGRVLAYFAASHEDGGLRTPFHDRYGTQGISYDDEHCIQLNGPISLHRDISCGTILSAELDTYRTENRAMVGHSTDGAAVVSAAPASADTDGKCVFVAADGTLREPENLDSWGRERTTGDVSVSQTLVCPVLVTPEDCPCPLPGLFYVRRCIHEDQVIFAGGWMVDDGALYEGSVTLLFDEGPTEVASVSADDIGSGNLDDRIVEQFSRGRSQHGSAVGSVQVQGTDMNKPELIGSMIPRAFENEEGRKGLNAVNVKVVGEQGDDDEGPGYVSTTALDAPLVHLADAAGTGNDVKFKAGAELSKAVN